VPCAPLASSRGVRGQDIDVLFGGTVTGVTNWAADLGTHSRLWVLDVSNVTSGGTHSDGWNRKGKSSE
jgi:hypothetical protein